MPTLVPSILETSQEKFLDMYNREIRLPGVQRIQIDFGDGVFVPNTMIPVAEIDVLNPSFHYEAHLMMQNPKDFLDYQICGFQSIIVHYEAYESEDLLRAAIASIKDQGMEPGICLKVETPVGVLQNFYPDVKHFQLMGIHPGFQGTAFIPETLERLRELRKLYPTAILEVDGGMNETNIKSVVQAGADLIILGSVITKVPNMADAWEKLQEKLAEID